MVDPGSNPNINNVSDTSFWVAYYRAQESLRPDALFQDRFAKLLIGERGKQIAGSMPSISKYVEWTVVSRTVIIDRLIEKLIAEGVDAIINLGAGLDARPYRMNLPSDFLWVEADYPHIIQHKKEILKSETPQCKLVQFEIDLANDEKRRALLSSVLPDAKKILVLTEGVIPYLDEEQTATLGKDLHNQKRIFYWITEYFHPMTYSRLKGTVRAAKMKNAPFKFYPKDWYGFFRKLGWVEKETRYGGEIAKEFKRRPPMPLWGHIVFFFMPLKVKQQMLKAFGYVVFKRDV